LIVPMRNVGEKALSGGHATAMPMFRKLTEAGPPPCSTATMRQ
jgi:hypothetical protein